MKRKCYRIRNGGFTLIELLVVVGIIAVLIAILLPALNSVRSRANVVACASNVRQIVTATLEYAASNHGLLPPRAYAGVSSVDSNGFDFIYLTFPFPGRTTPLSCNIGTLLQDGYLGRVDPTYLNAHFETMAMAPVRFDPGVGDVSFEVQGLYGSHAAIDTPVIWSSSYEYNPHWAFTSAYGKWSGGGTINTGVDTVSWFTSVNGYNAHKALVTDLNSCGAEANPNYLGLAPHKAGAFWVYNLGYIDGHVASVRDRVMMNCPKGSYLGYAIRIPTETEGYDSVLDALEAEAENRDPVTSGGDPRMPPLTRALGTGGSSTPWEYRLQGGNAGNVPGEQTNPSKPGYGLYHPLVPWQ